MKNSDYSPLLHQTYKITCGLFLALLLMAPLHADTDLPLFESDYVLKRSGFTLGTMHRSLHRQGETYTFESHVKPKGLLALFSNQKIHEKSRWLWVDEQIISQDFLYTSGSGKKQKRSTIVFNRDKGRAYGQYKTHDWALNLPVGLIYDRANYQIALMRDVRLNKRILEYRFIKKGKIQTYRFERLGRVSIKTAIGSFDAIKLRRKAGKRSTTVWLAPRLNYAPVKIEQIEKAGEKYTLLLKAYRKTQ